MRKTMRKRKRIGIALGFLATLGVLLLGVRASLLSFENDVSSWLPEEDAQRVFEANFGSEVFLVVAWDGIDVDDARIPTLRDRCAKITTRDGNLAFDQVFDGGSLVSQLLEPPTSFSRAGAFAKLRGSVIGGDEQTFIYLRATDAGWDDRHQVVARVEAEASEVGISQGALRLGGPMRNSVEVDRLGVKGVAPLAVATFFLALILTFSSLPDWRAAVPVLLYASVSWMASLSLLVLLGGHLDSILIALPALVYVLSASSAIHMVGYLRTARKRLLATGPSQVDADASPMREALKIGFAPCTIATMTTLVGLFSLTVSQMQPVSQFGFFAAIGVFVAWVGQFTVWPLAVYVFDNDSNDGSMLERDKGEQPFVESGSSPASSANRGHRPDRDRVWWWPCCWLSPRRAAWVLVVAMLAVPVLVLGVARLKTSVGVADMFAEDTDGFHDYEWFEQNVSGLIPVESVVHFESDVLMDEQSAETVLAKLALVEDMRRFIHKLPEVTGAMAPTSFLPEPSSRSGMGGTIQRRVLAAKVRAALPMIEERGWLAKSESNSNANAILNANSNLNSNAISNANASGHEELWRISSRLPGMESGFSHADFLTSFRNRAEQFMLSHDAYDSLQPKLSISGTGLQVARGQKQLLVDMGKSLLLAFALIASAMVFVCRSLKLGLLAMLPNVFPTLFVFGCMGLLGGRIDAGAMITATVALGIAVDDTSHFVWWFSKSQRSGESLHESIVEAFTHCATPMLRTTVICGIGLGVFVWSPFIPVSQFGAFMATLLFAALIGDLLLFPAALAALGGDKRARVEARTAEAA
ncbi:MAG: hypothetical protein AAGG44_08925 [Planctomycetota bacterium]